MHLNYTFSSSVVRQRNKFEIMIEMQLFNTTGICLLPSRPVSKMLFCTDDFLIPVHTVYFEKAIDNGKSSTRSLIDGGTVITH